MDLIALAPVGTRFLISYKRFIFRSVSPRFWVAGHKGRVNWVSFSPDGKTIASASADKTVKIWGCNGSLLKTLKGHSGKVWSVSILPDSKMIASASDDNTVKLWSYDGTSLYTRLFH